MTPIFPRSLVLIALAGALLSALGARAETPAPLPATVSAPRPLAAVEADLAALDPYAPEFEVVVERLLAEQAAARVEVLAATR